VERSCLVERSHPHLYGAHSQPDQVQEPALGRRFAWCTLPALGRRFAWCTLPALGRRFAWCTLAALGRRFAWCTLPALGRRFAWCLWFVLGVLLLTYSGDASAKGCKGRRDVGFGWTEAFVTALSLPPLVVNGDDTSRRLVGIPTPASSQMLVGVGVGVEARCDYLLFHIARLRFSPAFAGAVAAPARADGGTASVSRGTVQIVDIGLPLFGLPSGFELFPGDGWKVAFKLDVGFEHVWTSATVTSGFVAPSSTGGQASISSWDAYLRAQLAGCTRLGALAKGISTSWACLTVSPILYDRGAFPGVSTGLRVDF